MPPPAEATTVDAADLRAVAAGEPRVVVRPQGGSYRIDVFDRDRLGLFADTAGLLAAYGLVVRTAILRTVDGVAANEWHVESPSTEPPDEQRIVRGLERLAQGDRGPLGLLERRRQFAARPSAEAGTGSPGQARALVVPHASDEATVIEVRAQDRPGPAPRARHGLRQGGPVGALGAHRDVRRADPRHLLRHRVRRPPAVARPRSAQTVVDGHRHLRRGDGRLIAPSTSLGPVFTSLSDRLTATFKNLRGKGRLSESDVNATVRDIRLALLDADVSLPVVKQFTSAVRERALGAEVSAALNPGQQVVKIVNEELVGILGGQTRTHPVRQEPARP